VALKNQSFRCFQIIEAPRIISESKPCFSGTLSHEGINLNPPSTE